MRNGFRQSMAWLHAWSGLVVGWVLFAVFVTGTASYYRSDISAFMRPELAQRETWSPAELGRAADLGRAHLEREAKGARAWFIGLPKPGQPALELFWRTKPGAPPGRAMLDPESGAPVQVRDTKGGDFLFRFHFELSMAPLWGRWIVGICALIMLVALVSGIVTHRRIFADFFTFRRQAKTHQRRWLDAHNVAGVAALPFHLMITYTGLVTLAVMYMPWGVNVAYKGDSQAFFVETAQITAPRAAAGRAAAPAPLAPMVERALAMNAERLERLTIQNPGDAQSVVVAVFEEPHGLMHRHPQVAFDGVTGAVLEVLGEMKPAIGTFATMVGIHEAHFAGPAMRLLFFLCGLLGCAMVATGLVLWSVARLPKPGERPFPAKPFLGLRLVDGLNVGTVAGLPAAVAAYFLANRLLPLAIAERAEWEVRAFFAVWIATTAYAFLRRRSAWRDVFLGGAALYLAVAAVDLLGVGSHAGPFLVFDAVMVALGAALALAGFKARGAGAPAGARDAGSGFSGEARGAKAG